MQVEIILCYALPTATTTSDYMLIQLSKPMNEALLFYL